MTERNNQTLEREREMKERSERQSESLRACKIQFLTCKETLHIYLSIHSPTLLQTVGMRFKLAFK